MYTNVQSDIVSSLTVSYTLPGALLKVMTNCRENSPLTITIGEKYRKDMMEVLYDFITTKKLRPPFDMQVGE